MPPVVVSKKQITMNVFMIGDNLGREVRGVQFATSVDIENSENFNDNIFCIPGREGKTPGTDDSVIIDQVLGERG